MQGVQWRQQPLTNTGSIMSYVSILAESVGDVAVIRLNDQNSLNAISPQMVEELLAAFQEASRSQRAIVLTGVGRAFCSGANLGSVTYDPSDSYDAGVLLESHFNPLMMMIRDLPVPFVTAVNGPAVGVGSTIALSGDLIIAAQDAYFLQAFRRVGVIPDAGTAYLLTRAVGRVRAMEMMMLAEKLPAQRALDWGLVNRVVAKEDIESATLGLARDLASGPTKTLAEIRKSCWHALEADFAEQLARDRIVQRAMGHTADHREGIAAFFDKRPAIFTGN
jgi:2-(1,2-epoxy-1,2-dihydrophenyl)acetyl-CoA isomerase